MCPHLGPKEYEGKLRPYCSFSGAFTSGTHCQLCEIRGKKYIKNHFDLRDNKTKRRIKKPLNKKKTKKPKRNIIKLPLEIEQMCLNCHESRNCPNTIVCCGGQVTVTPSVPCPQEKWDIQKILEEIKVAV